MVVQFIEIAVMINLMYITVTSHKTLHHLMVVQYLVEMHTTVHSYKTKQKVMVGQYT